MKIIIKYLLIFFSKALAKKKFNKYFIKDTPKLVNLGCGLHCLPNWVNIDGSLSSLLSSKFTLFNRFIYRLAGSSNYYDFNEYNKVVIENNMHWYDLARGVPFHDNSVDIVFTSHFLEHLDKDDGFIFLQNAYNSLKLGGILRLVIPDLDTAIQMLNEGRIDEVQDLFFYTSKSYDYSAHKYNYNFKTLSHKLELIGFKNIVKLSYKVGECPNLDFLDLYPDHSLYIEAYKS